MQVNAVILSSLPVVLPAARGFPETEGRQTGGQGAKHIRQPCLAMSTLFRIQLTAPMEGDTSLPGLCILHLLAES